VLDFWGRNRAILLAAEENAVVSRYNREVVRPHHHHDSRQHLFHGFGGTGPIADRAQQSDCSERGILT